MIYKKGAYIIKKMVWPNSNVYIIGRVIDQVGTKLLIDVIENHGYNTGKYNGYKYVTCPPVMPVFTIRGFKSYEEMVANIL